MRYPLAHAWRKKRLSLKTPPAAASKALRRLTITLRLHDAGGSNYLIADDSRLSHLYMRVSRYRLLPGWPRIPMKMAWPSRHNAAHVLIS